MALRTKTLHYGFDTVTTPVPGMWDSVQLFDAGLSAYTNYTTAIGGGYTFTYYDNTLTLYAEARQDATHTGRSDNGTAS